VNWFIVSAGGVLLITGIAKVVSASGSARLLDISDPIFAVSFRNLMLLVGLLELAVSAICFLTLKRQLSLCLVGWLATSFLLYRSGLWFLNWNRPCSCLGSLTDALHLSPELAETIAKVLSVYLLVGSITSLLYLRRSLFLRVGTTITHENV